MARGQNYYVVAKAIFTGEKIEKFTPEDVAARLALALAILACLAKDFFMGYGPGNRCNWYGQHKQPNELQDYRHGANSMRWFAGGLAAEGANRVVPLQLHSEEIQGRICRWYLTSAPDGWCNRSLRKPRVPNRSGRGSGDDRARLARALDRSIAPSRDVLLGGARDNSRLRSIVRFRLGRGGHLSYSGGIPLRQRSLRPGSGFR